jgi:hypothetical protein
MSNGLQKLYLYTELEHPGTTEIASLIVKQLPHLKIIELNCHNRQVPETLHILMSDLLELNFVIFHGYLSNVNELHSKLRDLQKSNMRAYRMEYCEPLPGYGDGALYVWL